MGLILAVLLLASTGSAADWRTQYRWSLMAVCGGAAADAVSSWRAENERNPILRSADGGFGWRGVGVKSAITGAGLLVQHAVLRKHPEHRKLAALMNYGLAGGLSALAARNTRIR